jgi:hypothetical protein
VCVFSRKSVGELVHIEGTYEHSSGRLQPLEQYSVFKGNWLVSVDFRTSKGSDTLYVKEVLYRIRQASQRRKRLSLCSTGINGIGFCAGTFHRRASECVNQLISGTDGRECLIANLARTTSTRCDGL